MKRRIAGGLTLALLTLLPGCSQDAAPEAEAGAERPVDAWVRTPAIRSAAHGPHSLILTGEAEPGARVVLRTDGGQAYAAAADSAGRFEIRMAPPAGHLLLRPEVQQGQDAILSPEILLVIDGGRGPVVLLRAGGAARRLDAGPALGAIDSDGRVMTASGATGSGPLPRVQLSDGPAAPTAGGPDGRWTALLGSSPGAATVRIGSAAFEWPGDAPRGEALSVERAGAGWRVGWAGPAGAWQTTWLPDPAR